MFVATVKFMSFRCSVFAWARFLVLWRWSLPIIFALLLHLRSKRGTGSLAGLRFLQTILQGFPI